MKAVALSLTPSFSSNKQRVSGLPIVVVGGHPPIQQIFFEKNAHQNWCPHEAPPQLNNDPPPPIWKTIPPLKHEVPFHELIPRKSTINDNLKSS